MHMRAGRRGRGRLNKTEKALPMLLEVVNTCMFNVWRIGGASFLE